MEKLMKKIILRSLSVIMAVMFVFSGLPLVSPAAEAATTTFTVAAAAKSSIAVRKTAKASATSVATLSKGTLFTVTEVANDSWFKVKTVGGKVGYVKISQCTLKTNAKLNKDTILYGDADRSISFGALTSGTKVSAFTSDSSGYSLIITSTGTSGYVKASALTAVTAATGLYQVTSATYVRTKAGTNYSSKGKIPKYLILKVTNTSNPLWYKVKLANGVTGYVLASKLTKAASGSKSTLISNSMYITTSDVNVRSGPGTSYSSKTTIDMNLIVNVTSKSNSSWYQIKTASGITGYVSSTYLKKVTCTVAASSTATATPTATAKATATPASTSSNYMTTGKMNVRKSASTSSTLVATVPKYFVVKVTNTSNSKWYKVKISDGTVGYILAANLKKTTEKVTPVTSPLYTTTANVNLRSGAGLSYSAKGSVNENTVLMVTSTKNSEWYKVKLADGTTGYIYSEYLKSTPYTKKSTSATATPTAAATATSTATATPKATSTTAPTAAPSETYYKVTATSGLNVRSAASSSADIVDVLSYDAIVTLVEKTSSSWYKVKTSSTTGYVSTDYIELYNPTATEEASLSGTISIPQYKSYYLGTSSKSSDTSIATVKNGFIYGVSPGTTTVGSYKIIVTAPEAVRFAFSSPNYPTASESITLKAVTDTNKSAVRFKISSSSGATTYTTSTYTTESNAASGGYAANSVKIWTKTGIKLAAGDYTLTVESMTGSTWSSGSYTTTIHVSSQSTTATTADAHYASDDILEQIANYEGYVPVVEDDALVSNTPTLAYGIVVYKGDKFYNNVTKTEAYAMMLDKINKGTFTSSLNKYVSDNNLKINQAQWDALLSFSYNVGTGWMSSSYVSTILKNTVYGDISVSSSSPKSATTVFKTNFYKSASSSSDTYSQLSSGTAVSVIGKTATTLSGGYKDMWYKISYDGKTGYVRAGTLQFSGNSGMTHDLAYVDPQAFSQNLLDWHKASNSCIEGLFYRRLSECKIFLYGNYSEGLGTTSYTKNTYGFSYDDDDLGIHW